MKRITVTIRDDQKKWLDAHPSTSPSGLLQEAIDERTQEVEGYITMEQFEIEREGLHKKVMKVLEDNPDRALAIKSIIRKMGLPKTFFSETKVRFAINNLNLLGKVDYVIKGNEEFFTLKRRKKKRGEI